MFLSLLLPESHASGKMPLTHYHPVSPISKTVFPYRQLLGEKHYK